MCVIITCYECCTLLQMWSRLYADKETIFTCPGKCQNPTKNSNSGSEVIVCAKLAIMLRTVSFIVSRRVFNQICKNVTENHSYSNKIFGNKGSKLPSMMSRFYVNVIVSMSFNCRKNITSTPPTQGTGLSNGIVSPLFEFMWTILSLSSKSTVYIASKMLGRWG